jgi:hypothetical protein
LSFRFSTEKEYWRGGIGGITRGKEISNIEIPPIVSRNRIVSRSTARGRLYQEKELVWT